MGSGAPRELSSNSGPSHELDPALSKHVAAALAKLDELNPEFKQARIDEKNAQLTKIWMDVNNVIVDHLREASMVLINAHQIGLEMGSDGGGQGATPWMEESSQAFPRVEFKLLDAKIQAMVEGEAFATHAVSRDIPYEWVQKVVVKWIVMGVKAKSQG